MILVVASSLDPSARELVRAWSDADARMLSAEDLCSAGWSFFPLSTQAGWLVADGKTLPVAAVEGVVVRRPAVTAEELTWIADDDRAYVAAEINAFLVAWLCALPCCVLNRPTPTSLCGPAWSQLHWRVAAARRGIHWSESAAAPTQQQAIFCRSAQHGASSAGQNQTGRELLRASATQLLGVEFDGEAVAAVTVQPQLSRAAVRAMVLSQLLGEVCT